MQLRPRRKVVVAVLEVVVVGLEVAVVGLEVAEDLAVDSAVAADVRSARNEKNAPMVWWTRFCSSTVPPRW